METLVFLVDYPAIRPYLLKTFHNVAVNHVSSSTNNLEFNG